MQMMMQVALAKSQPVISNAPTTIRVTSSVDAEIKSRKVELVLAALSSLNSPYLKRDIFNTPSFIKSVELIKRMSFSGKLFFARTLLDQLLSESDL